MSLWGNTDDLAGIPKFIARTATVAAAKINTTTKRINILETGTGFATGDAVKYTGNATGPTTGNTYYVRVVGAGLIELYDTYAHAIATATTGRVNFTNIGTGTHTLQRTGAANTFGDHVYNGYDIIFVDTQEALVTANRAKGITGPGWWLYKTYTDANSKTRHKVECLVAMKVDVSVADTEKVINGTFATDLSGWTAGDGTGATITWDNGTASCYSGANSNVLIKQSITGLTVGKAYTVTANFISSTPSQCAVYIFYAPGYTLGPFAATPYTAKVSFIAGASTLSLQLVGGTAGATAVIDNVSLKEANAGDAEDAIGVDLAITIGTQPSSTSVVTPATATFTVAATINGNVPLTYQWQIQQGGSGSWTNISGATSTSYTTGASAVSVRPTGGVINGDKFRVVISGANITATSSAATLTVTAV